MRGKIEKNYFLKFENLRNLRRKKILKNKILSENFEKKIAENFEKWKF